jgi:hypothetical protein
MHIKHVVWPTGVPPVSTALWNQDSWNRFAEGYRPKGYKGGMFDEEAYAEFKLKTDLKAYNAMRKQFKMPAVTMEEFVAIESKFTDEQETIRRLRF